MPGSSRAVAMPSCLLLWRRPRSRPPSHCLARPYPRAPLLLLEATRPPQNTRELPARTRPCLHPRAPMRGGRAWSAATTRHSPAPLARPSPPSNSPCPPRPLGHGGTTPRALPHSLHVDHRGPAAGLFNPHPRPLPPHLTTPLPSALTPSRQIGRASCRERVYVLV